MQDWGFIYVLTNDYMPGIVKIGRTAHAPIRRAKELGSTGVPGDFQVAYAAETSCMVEDEARVHRSLDWLPISGSEFFHCNAGCAKRAIERGCEGIGYSMEGCSSVLGYHPDEECSTCMSPETFYMQRGD